jgi:DNA-binding transcriptional MocR family regulator
MAVASFLADGAIVQHLRRLGRYCAETSSLLRRCIAEALPEGTRVTNPSGGLFLWVELPLGCDSYVLMHQCLDHGFSVASGRPFSSRQHYARYLRLNAAIPWSAEVQKAIARLGRLAARQAATAREP